ncbi:MAG TPA: GNAT family N-acetyltransferase [Thermoleophilaceae bacterium]|nr:GNAT family N-acetyltransferase [Thermoleophilaceae bacterium]
MTVRPMEAGDVDRVRQVTLAAFARLEAASGVPEPPGQEPERARIRFAHLLATDPGGCWVAQRKGRVVGAAIAVLREGLWGLSLLVVHPAQQSTGLGRELLARAAEYGRDARGRIILASPDARALRAYLGLGLDLVPAAAAAGVPRGVRAPGEVRRGEADDAPLLAEVDHLVRGAAHGADIDKLVAAGHRLLVHPGRGYVTIGRGSVSLLAARDEDAATGLLRAALHAAGEDVIRVEWLTADQQWAVRECHRAGLSFHLDWGAVLTDGDTGPLRPYLPNGAYL